MINLICNITNLYHSARWHDRELCNSLSERLFICIYAILHPDTSLFFQLCRFCHQNEGSHATNLPKKFTFKKSEEILIVEKSAFRSPNEIQQDFIKESFGHKENNLRPLTKMPSIASSSTLKDQGAWPEEAKPKKTDAWQSLLKTSSGSTTTSLLIQRAAFALWATISAVE